MIAKRILIIGLPLAASCIILAATAWTYIEKENQRSAQEHAQELASATDSANQLVHATCEEILLEASSQLISMHQEGLAFQLTRWKNKNPLVQSIFIWTPDNGYSLAPIDQSQIPPSLFTHNTPDTYRTINYNQSTSFDWDIGYFQENLENIQYSKKTPSPTITWDTIPNGAHLQWIVWHQLYPQGTHSGFTLNTPLLLETLQTAINTITPPHLTTTIKLKSSSNSQRSSTSEATTQNKWNTSKDSSSKFPFTLNTQLTSPPSPLTTLLPQALIAISLILALGSCILIIQVSNRKYHEALKKTNFVALVSHELKTPLTSISMYAELIDNPKITPEKQHKFATTISRQSDRLRTMIDNLLTLSSIDQNKEKPKAKEINLTPLIQELISELEPSLKERKIVLTPINLKESFIVQGDEISIRRVFINLIENAVKYATGTQHIEIEFKNTPHAPIAIVRDQGPGIPSSKAQTIFESFTQLKDDLTDKSPGIGIGLSISRNLMRDLGGNLHLDTFYKKGAAFILTFKS